MLLKVGFNKINCDNTKSQFCKGSESSAVDFHPLNEMGGYLF